MKYQINDDEASQWAPFWASCSQLLTIYPDRPATMSGDAEAKQLERQLKERGAELLSVLCDNEHWVVEASVGKGNWAAVPWVAFFDSRETTSAQKGVYPVIHFSSETSVGIRIGLGVAATAFRGREDEKAGEVWEELGSESRQELTESGFVDVVSGTAERTAIGSGGLARRYDKGMVFEQFVDLDKIKGSPIELTQSLKTLMSTYKQWVEERLILPEKTDFVGLMQVLANERVVLVSPKQGSRYCISDVDDRGCTVQRLDSESPARVTASAFESRLAWLRQNGGEAHRKEIDNTVAVQILYLQMPEIGLKADRQMAIAFQDDRQRADNFISLIKSMQTVKLYKPVILALVIEAIRDEELLDNNIHFGWLLPRFITRMREHGEEIGEQQLAEGFGRLASDLFWMLAHHDTNELLDVSAPTPAKIREKVSHARLQEAYWQMLQDGDCQSRVLDAIKTKWWPNKTVVNAMPKYWLLAPGEGGVLWDLWQTAGIINIGWKEVGDLSNFDSVDAVAARASETYPDYGSKAVARMLWHFCEKMTPGDVVFAKRGRSGVYGWGVITGGYEYRDQDVPHPHVRTVDWKSDKEVDMPTTLVLAMHTLSPMESNQPFLCEMRRTYEGVPGLEGLDCGEEIDPPVIVPPAETDLAEATSNLIDAIAAKGFIFHPWQIATYITAMRTKPFVILAGVSGTGKSKLPALVAELTTGKIDRVSVRPDWTDSSDVLGYVDLQDGFRPGVVLKAARGASTDTERFCVCLLDEMNIARVEHYFAEVLSAIEDRKKSLSGGYESTKLVAQTLPSTFQQWQEQTMPANFGIVGTVNMDESSHGFSRKVLDRAFTLELSEVDLDLDQSTPSDASVDPVYWPASFWHCRATRISECDHGDSRFQDAAARATTVLQDANKCLVHSQLQVGYRTRDEVILFLLNADDLTDSFITRNGERVDPLDLALMMKVLPRLVGGSNAIRRTMIGLLGLAHGQSVSQLASDSDDAETAVESWAKAGRPDAIEHATYPRTASRLCLMWERLTSEGYTSFWL
ncbi:5-methylcytosine-specific restriction enzyme B [Roseimaritima multifibrata]|uniref:5-methylcytosine-specific restriction enzyme B n=1 Tax=Roseimaritima multifibrata TaxID=1930274 RepID=A0A517MIF6_9BACT|nr:DUF3578 domain-containing protein [Roseimaritima multifibrata]QDS94650.1 5-methylcytosine-specific restriction enzyme B [Roseimaritima multifibrata]